MALLGKIERQVRTLTSLRYFFALWIAALIWTPASALDSSRGISQFQHASWTTKDGMPADIWSITQTRDGYLWLGSVNGLYRFDGLKIEKMAAAALPSPSIHAIAATSEGGLWIGYERPVGVVSYYKDGRLTNYPIAAPASTSVHNIVIGPDGTVWLCTPDSILKFNGKQWKIIDNDWGTSLGQAGGGVWQFGIAPDGTVWSKSEHNLYYLRKGATRFVQAKDYAGGPEAFAFTSDGQLATSDAVTHRLYVLPVFAGAPDGALPNSKTIAVMPQAAFGPILFDRDKTLWYTSIDNGGLSRVRTPGITAPFELFTKTDGLSSNLVHTMFEDREGNVWVGTSVGLDRFTPANVVTEPRVPVGYTGRMIKATPQGLYAYTGWTATDTNNKKGSSGSLYHLVSGEAPAIVAPDIGRLRGMFSSKKVGGIWTVSAQGVQQLKQDGTSAAPLALPDGIKGPQVYSVAEDNNGAFWISAFHGGVFRQTSGGWRKVAVKPRTSATAVLIADPEGGMWIRYSGGSLFRVRDDVVDDFSYAIRDIGDITLIVPDSQGLIIGGESGIAIFDGTRLHRLRAADIPALSVVTGIARTSEGNTWIFTQAGILRVTTSVFESAVRHSDASAFHFEMIDSNDGLPGAPYGAVYGSSVAAGPDGRVWFTTGNGLAWIDPHNLHHNSMPPPVAIRSLTANDRTYDSPDGVILTAGTSKTEIEYTALSMSMPNRLHFRYKLDGIDDSWVDAGNRRQAFYTGLGPGLYRFHVIASNNDGIWNNQGANFTFRIPPTFLQSRTFFALCVAAAAGLLWGAYQWRLKQLSVRLNSQLEARLGERERIARALHDTLLQGFHGLMLRFQSVAESIPADQPARNMIEEVMTRADHVLTESRERVQDLRGGTDDGDIVQALENIAKDVVGGELVDFKVITAGTPSKLHPVVCDELIQLASEAIVNAYRHAKASTIDVTLIYRPAKLRMSIRDNGVGMEKTVIELGARRGHFGLAGMRERAKKIKAEFAISSRMPGGTEIEVIVPAALAYIRPPKQRWQFWRSDFRPR